MMARNQALVLALAIFFALLPPLLGSYLVYALCLAGTYSIVALGLNLLTGYSGQVSLGHAGFVAIGAYSTALLTLRVGLPFWLAVPTAGIIAGLAGLGLGIPALRLSGPYLAIATLGFGVALPQMILNWDTLASRVLHQPALVGLTGGAMGLRLARPSLGALGFAPDLHYYYVIYLALLALIFASANLVQTAPGRALIAVRDNPLAARAVGVDIAKYRTMAFALSAGYAGLGGALLAHLVQFISPDSFNLLLSIELLTMIVVGGLASVGGSIAGALFVTGLTFALAGVKSLPMVIYGTALILCVLVFPEGLAGAGRRLANLWARRSDRTLRATGPQDGRDI